MAHKKKAAKKKVDRRRPPRRPESETDVRKGTSYAGARRMLPRKAAAKKK